MLEIVYNVHVFMLMSKRKLNSFHSPRFVGEKHTPLKPPFHS